MAVNRIAHVAFTGTSSAVDTTGATLFVFVMASITAPGSVTDSAGNTWTQLNTVTSGARRTIAYYVINPTTNATHTFSTGGEAAGHAVLLALDPDTPVFDQQNAGNTSGTSTVQPGSITPGGASNLLITSLGGDANTSISIDAPFAVGESAVNTPYGPQGVAVGWVEQASATAQNPTWTVGTNGFAICSAQFCFTFTGGGGGGPVVVPFAGGFPMMGIQ